MGMCSQNSALADQLPTTWAACKASRQRACHCPATPATSTCRRFWALSKMAALLGPPCPWLSCSTGSGSPGLPGTTLAGSAPAGPGHPYARAPSPAWPPGQASGGSQGRQRLL